VTGGEYNNTDLPDIELAIIHEIQRKREKRFFDFHQNRVPQAWQTALKYMKDSTPPPQNYRALKGQKFEQHFRVAMEEHINEHKIYVQIMHNCGSVRSQFIPW
jgi:hypothetical protein